jgi:phosphoglycolate phosphatase-like HAD superfamily hydrolase
MGIRLALVTSNGENAVLGFLDKYDLHDVFEEHTSAELGLRKAEAIKLVLAKLSLLSEDCIFVGDTAKDIRESREAGVLAVGVLSGAHGEIRLHAEKPLAILSSATELPSLIRSVMATAQIR